MRIPMLVLVTLTGLSLAGCGGGAAHHGTAASGSASAPAGGTAAGSGPLPSGSPSGEAGAGPCKTVSYKLTAAGVQITARVAKAPVRLNFEADDRDDNPVTGDPGTSGVTYTFTSAHTAHTLLIKGVRSLDHLTVIALGGDASCSAHAG